MSTSVSRQEFPIDGTAKAMAARIQNVSRVLDWLETSETSRSRALSSMLTVAKSYCLADSTAQKFPTVGGMGHSHAGRLRTVRRGHGGPRDLCRAVSAPTVR